MKIDFKGYKYVIIKRNGFHNRYTNNEVQVLDDGYLLETYLYPKDTYDLHTNPDYKEIKVINIDKPVYNKGKISEIDYKESKEMIYTQEMYDNKEVPKVGMKVSLSINEMSGSETGELLALTEQYIILKVGEEMEQHFHRGKWIFKPIDTRTDEEKAIDDMKLSYDNWYNEAPKKEVFQGFFDDIKAGKIHGVSFTESK